MFEQNLSSNRQKTNGCSFHQRLRQNVKVFVLTQEKALSKMFHFIAIRKRMEIF